MRFIKKLLLVFTALVSVVLITALFLDKDYHIERSIEINASKDQLFEYVKYLRNQEEYSVWAKMDPEMKRKYAGTDGEVGFISAWKSKKKDVGAGEQEITKITPGKRIDYELRFKEPFEAKHKAFIDFKKISKNKTRIAWGFDGSVPWPMNITLIFMDMDEMLGPDLEGGLKNLKEIQETNSEE